MYPDVRDVPVAWKIETRRPKRQAEPVDNVVLPETYTDERWTPFDYTISAEVAKRSEETFLTGVRRVEEPVQATEDIIPSVVGKIEPSESVKSEPTTFRLPRLIEHYWSLFPRPPYLWNRIRAHKALIRCLMPDLPQEVVTSMKEQYNSPGSILRPLKAQLEREPPVSGESYPAEWDAPSKPDTVPPIKPLTFHEWQPQHPSFCQLGLASLPPKNNDSIAN